MGVRIIKQCIALMVPAALATLYVDVNSVTAKLTTHHYQELAFCGANNNDFIISHPLRLLLLQFHHTNRQVALL